MSDKNQNKNKQETLASTATKQTTATTTTVGTIISNSDMQYGWICPKCGKVHAPWKDSCDCYLNVPYTPPNTPIPTPFDKMPSWPQAPEVGDAPGWWRYGPKCITPIPGEPINCSYCVGSDDTAQKLQIYNTELISTDSTDLQGVTTINDMSEFANDNMYTPLKDLNRVLCEKT